MAAAVAPPMARPASLRAEGGRQQRERGCAINPICANNPKAIAADRVRKPDIAPQQPAGKRAFAEGEVTDVADAPGGNHHRASIPSAGGVRESTRSAMSQDREDHHDANSP